MTTLLELTTTFVVFLFIIIALVVIFSSVLLHFRNFTEDTARDHEQAVKKWSEIQHDLNERYKSINSIVEVNKTGICNNSYFEDNSLRLVMVDALVEKAQIKLTERARSYLLFGITLYIFSFFMILISSFVILFSDDIVAYYKSTSNYYKDIKYLYLFDQSMYITNETYRFILTLLKKTASGGVLIGFCYILVATGNSCFRESTILMHRRHSLRYIRLLSYQNQGRIDVEALKDVFGIGDVMNSGFDRVKTIALKDNWIGAMFEAFKNIAAREEKGKK